jgi:outer membrane biosynthesis protein TonB
MFEYDNEEDRSFIQRHRGLVLIAVILVIGVGVYFLSKALSGSHQSAPRQDDMMTLSLPPPPPPPPRLQPTPPPQQTPPPEQQQDQKMVEQQPVQDEKKEEAPKEKPDAPAPLGTSITGPGGGQDLGLGSGLGGGGGYGNGGGGGSKYGWYASEVQTRIADALRGNPRTRTANMNIVIRIWPDASGRISKARISGSTGDPSLDAALQNDILTGLQLADPPPADMPLPIVMRVSAQRPQ